MTSPIIKPLLLVSLVLVVPLVMLAFFGESFSTYLEHVKSNPPSGGIFFIAVVAILASDLVLPVPSGPISTLAGSQLGIFWGALAVMLGMTLGGVIAFFLAKRWGRPLAERFADKSELTRLEQALETHGLWLVLVTRSLPVLAEACVLVVGTLQMSWRRFLTVLIASNLVIALSYAILGRTASKHGWLIPAVLGSMASPILLAILLKNWHKSIVGDEPHSESVEKR